MPAPRSRVPKASTRSTAKPVPVIWATAIVIVLVFGAVSYRVVRSCEESSFELVNTLRVRLGGCNLRPSPEAPTKVSTHVYVQMGSPAADPKTWKGPGVPAPSFREVSRGEAELIPAETYWIRPANQTMAAERPCPAAPSVGSACLLDSTSRLSAYLRNSCSDAPAHGDKVSRGCSRATPLSGTPGQDTIVQCCFFGDGPTAKGIPFNHALEMWFSSESGQPRH
jgi:hypothetical protein